MSLRRFGFVLLTVSLAAAAAGSRPAGAQLAPIPQDEGAAGLGLALRRLPVTARVLFVTAHPDDENNGVLVRLSRGLGVRTALLTLTRGDGGQNEIGPELFQAIGVLRTEELAAVHRYDAAEQYFGRAYEFGYSFSVEETLERWGHQETLADVVKIVRAFRPDVILTLPLEAPGGGQHHQAAARLAVEAFRAAADPVRFPEQIEGGLRPWQAAKVYQGGTGGGAARVEGARPVVLDTSVYDPLLGMTWHELGSLARSSHKCQGAGQLKASPGAGRGQYFLVDSEPKATDAESDVLDGIDTSLRRLLRFVPADHAPSLADDLTRLEAQIREAREAYDAAAPEKTVPALAGGLLALRQMRAAAGKLPLEARAELLDRLAQKDAELQAALRLGHGLAFEARSADDPVVPGETFQVTANVWNRGGLPVRLDDVTLRAPAGWTVTRVDGEAREVPHQWLRLVFSVTVAADARASQPYWRLRPGVDRYDLDRPADDTLPWSPPDLAAVVRYHSTGADAVVESPVVWRYEGRWVGGEKQKVVSVVPALSVRVKPALLVVPASGQPVTRELRVTVVHNTREARPAMLRLETPPGWSAEPAETTLSFRAEGEEVTTRALVKIPAGVPEGAYEIRAVAVREGREYREGDQVIAYDHIQERRLYRPAVARALALDVRVAPGARVGYVMGAGDEVADAIRQLDIPLTLLTADDLAYGDLSRYTTIVTGIRAYQTRADLRAHHRRLMEYVEQGGHLVVQYNKFEFNQAVLARVQPTDAPAGTRQRQPDSPFAPYPAAVSSSRVTDERAPVDVLVRDSPAFNHPNRLGESDWAGWVQERGLYFLEARDPRYTELVAMTDPFPKNPGRKTGALVEARVGKGTWTYVGLGLFRQLPAGTTGAYRLLANLLSRPRGR